MQPTALPAFSGVSRSRPLAPVCLVHAAPGLLPAVLAALVWVFGHGLMCRLFSHQNILFILKGIARVSLTSLIHKKSSFNISVISFTLLLTIGVTGVAVLAPKWLEGVLNGLKNGVFQHFSWFYVLAVSLFLLFLVGLAFSGLGRIKLGANEEGPEFSYPSWLAMLFAAGMGVGLMFFGVAEPLSHLASPITDGGPEQLQQAALLHTLFHWGVHAWAIYAVIALALAYFGFRYKLPLALRSCFYPLLKDRINGRAGDAIDTLALCATLFGIITTLGFGAAQMGAGLAQMGWVGESSFGLQVLIIAVVMTLAVVSAASGVGRGVKRLSEINLALAMGLLLFVLFTGPTLHLLGAFSDNIGTYLSNVLRLSFKAYTYDSAHTGWFTGWTVLYWAWWCSWAPFVGLFIARISRGRSIREFVFGVLAVPSVFSVLWFTVFGNSAIWFDQNVAQGALAALAGSPEKLLFVFLEQLPLTAFSSILALLVLALFFITSADSGIYVLNNIASRDKGMSTPRWQTVMWGVLICLLSIALMRTGGIGALQTMTLVVALPFALLMLLMCLSLLKALSADQAYFSAKLTPTSIFWSGQRWRERLGQMMNQTQEQDILRFFKQTALPAMRDLRQELTDTYGLSAEVNAQLDAPEPNISLVIKKETLRDFVYGIKSVQRQVAEQLLQDELLPHIQQRVTHEPITYFGDGRDGYDVQYMSREELIADMLKQYERYLSLLDGVGREILAHAPEELGE